MSGTLNYSSSKISKKWNEMKIKFIIKQNWKEIFIQNLLYMIKHHEFSLIFIYFMIFFILRYQGNPLKKKPKYNLKNSNSFIKKIEFDFKQQKKGERSWAFFKDFLAFSNHFKVLIEEKNLFSLHTSLDKIVRKILIGQTIL